MGIFQPAMLVYQQVSLESKAFFRGGAGMQVDHQHQRLNIHSDRSQDSQLMLAEFNGYTMKVRKQFFTWRRENEKHGCESLML